MRTADGSGTVCDRLLEDCERTGLTSAGEADDQDIGVVAAVDALHGLGEEVNCVDGLLTVLIVLMAGVGRLCAFAAKACSSGMSRGGRLVADGYF